MKRKPTLIMLLLGTLGVVLGVVAREPIVEWFRSPLPNEDQLPAAAPEVILPPVPEEIARPHLSWADRECQRALDEHMRALDRFFADSKRNSRYFADAALGWSSKWKLIVDHVPFTKGGRHDRFIREKFEELIFKPDQLETAVKQVVANYLKHVESIESQMLVRLRADVADFPSAYVIANVDEAELRASYDRAIERALDATARNLRADIGSELVSLITGEVLTQVAVRLGVSAGVLGTGAASSWATFGVGLVVAVIVDQMISWIWDWYADPKGELTGELNRRLDELNRLIVNGSHGAAGLRQRLEEFTKQRSALRDKAVISLLQPL